MLFSYFQKREILREAVSVCADRLRAGAPVHEAVEAAQAIVKSAVFLQEMLVEKDGTFSDRLLLRLRKARDGMIEV